MPTTKILPILAVAGYPLLLHLAVVSNNPLAVTALLCAAMLVYFFAYVKRSKKPLVVPIIGLTGAVILLLLFREATTRYLLFSIPFLIYIALFWVFGRTLVGGREPLVAQISRRERGGVLPEELISYTRKVTLLWTGYFAAAAILSVILARHTTLATWSAFANVGSWGFLALLFFGEYFFRLARFPKLPHSSPIKVIRRLLSDGLPNTDWGHQ